MTTSPLDILPVMDEPRPRTVTDRVFEALYDNVVNLTLPPGVRLSEAEVAAQMGVSRQPVRDAFYRLSQLGFLMIRPQRATVVTPISEEGVMQAWFIRCALEEATMRRAAVTLTAAEHAEIAGVIADQDDAMARGDRAAFHALDDRFHRLICDLAGVDFVWSLVRDNKGHMDRVRYLSLTYASPTVVAEHRQILAALEARDGEGAAAALRAHLGRITQIIDRLKTQRPEVFAD